MAKTTRNARTRALGAVHAGRKALGLDDETYRAYLEQLTGKRSASDCDARELALVLDHMRSHGFRRADGATYDASTQLTKARALWAELAAIGELRTPTEQGFCAWVERMTHRSRPEWCTVEQQSAVIEGLKKWLARARAVRLPDTPPIG